MASCCDARGCDSFFGRRFARRVAKRYRKRGLDATARQIVRFLESSGVENATVLEVGGGVGELQIELLKRGATRTVNLELSPAYEPEAGALLAEAGLTDRVDRRLHDIAVEPDGVEPADAVVLHRVVCCYPDYERLLDAAAGRARRLLVFSYPRRTPSRGCSWPARTWPFASRARSSGRSLTRPTRCSPSCGRAGSRPHSSTRGACGTSRASRAEHRHAANGQRRLVARMVEPIAPNFAALRRVSSNADRA
jgi:hypothetical protein